MNDNEGISVEDFRLVCVLVVIGILVLILFAQNSMGQALPDAPTPAASPCNGWSICPTPPKPEVKWWTFRGVYRDTKGHQRFNANAPALKTSKSMWLVYGAAHGAMFGAWALSNHKVEAAHSEIPAMAAVSGADLLMLKFFSPMMMFEAPIYGVQHYLRKR